MYSLISKKSYSEKIELFNQLLNINYSKHPDIYKIYFEDFIEELMDLIQELKEVGQIRNNYAHSNFSGANESKFIERKTNLTKNGIEKIYVRYDFNDMNEHFKQIYNVGDKLSVFNEKIWDCLADIIKKLKN